MIDTPENSSSESDARVLAVARRLQGAAIVYPAAVEATVTSELSEAVTEDRIAKLFTRIHGADWRYVNQWGKWLFWTGQYWRTDETRAIENLIRDICQTAACNLEKANQLPRVESATTVRNVERLLRSDPAHARSADDWDNDIWAFNTPKGTFDLRSGDCRGHNRDDLITKITSDSPEGDCLKWTQFLHTVTGGDIQLMHFLRRMVGYCIGGSTREQALFFLYGTGGNGKSLFLEIIAALIGDYATSASMDLLMESQGDRHPTELASLRGYRVVTATETEEGRRWAESKLKTMTGGDRISARFMRQDPFVFLPQFKIVMCGNHKPALRSIGPAMRRRFHLIPFTVTIPEHQRDPDLKSKLLEEAKGILQWALEGAMEWAGEGLRPPQAVYEATDEYFTDEDTVGLWMAELCEIRPGHREKASALYESFRMWSEARGERAPSSKWLSKTLSERGFVRWRDAQARGFEGIGLRGFGSAEVGDS